ncbi:MAG: hypothetical protein LBJ90_03475 [Treponema sp.]|nr:hypothetical protein [Treponema sp.]
MKMLRISLSKLEKKTAGVLSSPGTFSTPSGPVRGPAMEFQIDREVRR